MDDRGALLSSTTVSNLLSRNLYSETEIQDFEDDVDNEVQIFAA